MPDSALPFQDWNRMSSQSKQVIISLKYIINNHHLQGGFFNWSALKMTKCQITCKSLQKSSKCQNFLRVWHLVIFRADQLKKPPCSLNLA